MVSIGGADGMVVLAKFPDLETHPKKRLMSQSTKLNKTLTSNIVVRGAYNRNPGFSTRMSPGKRPNQSMRGPTSQKTNPTAISRAPSITKIFPTGCIYSMG